MSPERRTRASGPRPASAGVPAALPAALPAVVPAALPVVADPLPEVIAAPIPFDRTSVPDEAALTALTVDLAAIRSFKVNAIVAVSGNGATDGRIGGLFLGDLFDVEGFFVGDVVLGANIRDHFLHGHFYGG